MDNILGKRIKLLRNESELTQEEFRKKIQFKKIYDITIRIKF
ncbi:hypothetical protein CcarbDRAFT_4273 [Clostridium carboxidivorans P7]|uniref:Uncharacterized protein n=1 Tax=Clostridium carboxidivorans P7 TaxID=536227 RepID=C6PZQ6_9CLOT|nr:hypothetical protein CcarbDRAFT_4273 [Clostridium carboxidivorans P7]